MAKLKEENFFEVRFAYVVYWGEEDEDGYGENWAAFSDLRTASSFTDLLNSSLEVE